MAKKKTPSNTLALDEEPIVKAHAEPDSDDMGGESDEDEDDEDEDDEDEDEAEKSMPSEDDLVKAMADLENATDALENGSSLRQADLASKLANGETLSKSEAAELRAFLDGDSEESLEKSHREEFLEDSQIAQGVEISGFLDAQVSALTKSLDDLRESIAGGNGETRTLIGKLAKGMHAVGMSNVSLNRRIAQLEDLVKSYGEEAASAPQAPKAATRVGQRFEENRSIAGQPALIKSQSNGLSLTQAQIGATMTDLIKSTEQAGAKGFGMVDGVDFVHESAKFEQTRQISPSAMRVVLKKNGIDPTSVGL